MLNVRPTSYVPGFNVDPSVFEPGFHVDEKEARRWAILNAPDVGRSFSLPVKDAGMPGLRAQAVNDILGQPTDAARTYDPFGLDVLVPLPPLPYHRTTVNCAKIISDCKDRCAARFEIQPFPGPSGANQFTMMRRCIRDCVAPSGCSY